MSEYKTREDVPTKYRWDLSDIIPADSDFDKEEKKIYEGINKLKEYAGSLSDSKKLFEYLELDIDVSERLMNLDIYAMTTSDTNLEDPVALERLGRTSNLYTDYSVAIAFFEPELLKLEKDEYEKLFENKDLKKYKSYLDDLYRYKDHILTESEEVIVNKFTKLVNSYGQMSATLLNSNHDYGTITLDDGEEKTLMSTNYRKFMKKMNRDNREKTYKQFFNKIKEYSSTNAALLNNYVYTMDTLATTHNFNDAWEKKLFGLKLTNKVFDSLTSACENKKNVLNKYYDLKKNIIGVDKLEPWDGPVSIAKSEKTYTIEEAQELIFKALEPLGEDYLNHLKVVFDERCIDYCQYKGKTSGGYNVSGIGLKNSKILMSFNDNLESVSTIAHEAGHHVNHQYLYECNESTYRFHKSIVAEIASLTNECLLSYYLRDNGTKEEAMLGLNNIIDVIISNLFDAVQEGEMERIFYKYVHDGGTLTNEYLNNLYKETTERFFPRIVSDELEPNLWARRSHYYMYFYLFSYSVCISTALYISKEIYNGNKEMQENYIKYLKTGCDVDVLDVFKILGINPESEELYNKAIDNLEELIDDFIKLSEEV